MGNYNANKQNIYFKACHLKSLQPKAGLKLMHSTKAQHMH